MIHEALLFDSQGTWSSLRQKVGETYDGIQWSPQLMAHTGQELALHLGRTLDFPVAQIEFPIGSSQALNEFTFFCFVPFSLGNVYRNHNTRGSAHEGESIRGVLCLDDGSVFQ